MVHIPPLNWRQQRQGYKESLREDLPEIQKRFIMAQWERDQLLEVVGKLVEVARLDDTAQDLCDSSEELTVMIEEEDGQPW